MPRLVCLSDTHGHRLSVPAGDILLHSGDLTARGSLGELEEVASWLGQLPHRHKVVIAGNHDFCLQQQADQAEAILARQGLHYLRDRALELEGLRLWGSPWQPWFHDWAFNLARGPELAAIWKQIPEDTELLLTHGPPHGILDATWDGRKVGCEQLRERLPQLAQLKLHLFGHIHEASGSLVLGSTHFINASICDLRNRPVFPVRVVDTEELEQTRPKPK